MPAGGTCAARDASASIRWTLLFKETHTQETTERDLGTCGPEGECGRRTPPVRPAGVEGTSNCSYDRFPVVCSAYEEAAYERSTSRDQRDVI